MRWHRPLESPRRSAATRTADGSGLDGDATGAHRREEQPQAAPLQELVHRLPGALPVVVVVEDDDAAARHAVVEVLELVQRRLVPVRVEAQQRDLRGRALW